MAAPQELLFPWPPQPGTPAWKLERGRPRPEHPSEGPAPPGLAPAAWAASSPGAPSKDGLWDILWGHSISPQACRLGRTPGAAPSPSQLCRPLPGCPMYPPQPALAMLPKSQDINPTSCTELLGCVSHHSAQDISPRRGCHRRHQAPSAGLKDTISQSGAGAPRPSGLTC